MEKERKIDFERKENGDVVINGITFEKFDPVKHLDENGKIKHNKLEYSDKTPVGRVNVGDTIVMKDGNKYVVKEIWGPMYDPFTFEEVHGIFIFDDKTKSDRKINEKEIVEVIRKEEA